jgi:hypothetical protein
LDGRAQPSARYTLAPKWKQVVLVRTREVNQLHGQLVVVLQGVCEGRGVDVVVMHQRKHEPQKRRIPSDERVVVGGPHHEVIGKISATP